MHLDGKICVLKTHYDILSVKEDADYEEIRKSYRSAIIISHPDKIQGTTKTSDMQRETFLMVQKAWEILSDPKSRGSYDRELRDSRRGDTETADQDVNLEEMMVEEAAGEVLELFYECRCGDYFSVDSIELGEMGYSLGRRDESKIFIHHKLIIYLFLLMQIAGLELGFLYSILV
ncbi:hypothetical protein MKW94_028710 [Papaver nudicaule]|uniref:J domain-containing protein n=1 Tax=Papaver nudicaule TaxID=74823 RepID=A0AA41SJZ0_PAPNU|nr:hypothetical protein [Papaver nudicaule]